VIGVCYVNGDGDLILVTEQGKLIRLPVEQVRLTTTRDSMGVRLIDLEEGDRVADITWVSAEENDE